MLTSRRLRIGSSSRKVSSDVDGLEVSSAGDRPVSRGPHRVDPLARADTRARPTRRAAVCAEPARVAEGAAGPVVLVVKRNAQRRHRRPARRRPARFSASIVHSTSPAAIRTLHEMRNIGRTTSDEPSTGGTGDLLRPRLHGRSCDQRIRRPRSPNEIRELLRELVFQRDFLLTVTLDQTIGGSNPPSPADSRKFDRSMCARKREHI